MGPVGTPTVVCPLCEGLGVLTARTPVRFCGDCHGTGWLVTDFQTHVHSTPTRTGAQMTPHLVTCPFCQGTGQLFATTYEPCVMCQQTGRIPE